ncbi:MAG: hypothetical protein IDH49_04040 [Gammaproteobacteria bacterium]|nr:hypothetical protein [Gammaproteobacteria bacterium]
MSEYLQSLPDGWTIYVWLVAAAMILIAAGYFLWWAAKNEQFDEDIKYVVFDEKDKDKMAPEEFAKSQEVMKRQMQRREESLAEKGKKKLGT